MRKVHVITGGSSGIGLACAKVLKDGIVLISGRTEEKLINAKKEISDLGIDVEYKVANVMDKEDLRSLFEYARELGEISTVLNCAGVSGAGIDACITFKIDLIGTDLILREAYEYIGENATVILLASMMGHLVPPNSDYDEILKNPTEEGAFEKLNVYINDDSSVAYNFSKRGVQLLAQKYADNYGRKGARVISISPGIIMTPMAEQASKDHPEIMDQMRAMTPAGRNGKPEDIANLVEFLTSDKASFITGVDIIIDGGLVKNLKEANL